MKKMYAKILTLAFILSTIFISSQVTTSIVSEAARFNRFMNSVKSAKFGPIPYDEIEGNPFFNKNFLAAKVESATNPIPARYNMFTDSIEMYCSNCEVNSFFFAAGGAVTDLLAGLADLVSATPIVALSLSFKCQ